MRQEELSVAVSDVLVLGGGEMSGVDTRPVPVNIMAWPRVRDLITQQKFIYCYLYFNPDVMTCGCYLLSLDRCAADLGMTAASLDDALDEFSRRNLVLRDKSTGEIFVVDWPRWHNFSTLPARGALWSSIGRVQSRDLWIKIENTYKSIPAPSKDKDKASYEEGRSGALPLRWWKTEAGTMRAGELVGISPRPQEPWEDFRQRIRAQSDQKLRLQQPGP